MCQLISVIICAHNPKQNYLSRVLISLKNQTLPKEQWECILVDNASDTPLINKFDLSWHPHAHHVYEERLGLTSARLRGIQEAQADTLVFVDDDNVLDSDYLEVTLRISKDFPHLGAWGGQTRPEFEVSPPEWTKPYWAHLAIREFDRDKWSNLIHQYETTPCGAGMCVRKVVAEKYAYLVRNDSSRLSLDRCGQGLMSGGDSDLAFTACDLGLGIGVFTALGLTHLMPPSRLNEEYLLKLIEGMWYSDKILYSLRICEPIQLQHFQPNNFFPNTINKLIRFLELLKMDPRERRFYQAKKRGEAAALRVINQTRRSKIPETKKMENTT